MWDFYTCITKWWCNSRCNRCIFYNVNLTSLISVFISVTSLSDYKDIYKDKNLEYVILSWNDDNIILLEDIEIF